MWDARQNRDRRTVVCIACGVSVLRSEAREYDKEGDRWERDGKEFEHLCKECYRDLTHHPRGGLESLISEIETRTDSREEFLRQYVDAVRTQGSPEESES